MWRAAQRRRELKAASADWYEVRDQLADQVLKELGVKPTEAERQKMLRRGTSVAVGTGVV